MSEESEWTISCEDWAFMKDQLVFVEPIARSKEAAVYRVDDVEITEKFNNAGVATEIRARRLAAATEQR